MIPVNRVAAEVQLLARDSVDMAAAHDENERLGLGYEYNMMHGTPYIMRRRILVAPSGMPCTRPPFGTLVAIALDTGARLWEVPLGSLERHVPPGTTLPPEWGSVNLGGPIVTAGGVVFIGAALDRALKAYDIETGRELWRGPLPESGKATPMTYRLANGAQLVAITVGGGGVFGDGDHVVAFRLPEAPQELP